MISQLLHRKSGYKKLDILGSIEVLNSKSSSHHVLQELNILMFECLK